MINTDRLRGSLIALVMIGLTLVLAYRVGSIGLSAITFQSLIVLTVVLIGIALLFLGWRGVKFSFLAWVGLIVLGYRRLGIGGFQLHPMTVVMVGIAVVTFARITAIDRMPRSNAGTGDLKLPPPLLLFALFWVWGWLRGLANGYSPGQMLNEALNVALLLPIFFVVRYIFRREALWKPTLGMFYAAGSYIGLFGLLEYVIPGFSSIVPFPGFTVSSALPTVGFDGFARATFSFWGAAAAAFICFLSFPMVVPLWGMTRSHTGRALLLIGLALQLTAIYIGGYRSLWVLTLLVGIILSLRTQGLRAIPLLGFGFVVVITVISPSAEARFQTLLAAVQGNYQDTSSIIRATRIDEAIDFIQRNPLGMGWNSVGWVFNDPLQIAGALGIFPCLIFLAWYGVTLVRAWTLSHRHFHDRIMGGLFGCLLAVGSLFMTEGITFMTHVALPCWLVWALATTRLEQVQHPELYNVSTST